MIMWTVSYLVQCAIAGVYTVVTYPLYKVLEIE